METLVQAVSAGNVRAVTALLREGVSPDSRDEGRTALYSAALGGDVALAEMLLQAGADPNLLSSGPSDGTPLCAAACWGSLEVVRLLLAHGADPNVREDEWWTPLRWAAAHGHADVARILLEARADPDLCSPLPLAARRGSLATVRVLVDHGADPGQRDPEGRTALEIADEWAEKDVEAELVARVDLLAGTLESGRKGAEVTTTRSPLPDGTELVSVQASFPDGGATGADLETGHARIAALLRRLPP